MADTTLTPDEWRTIFVKQCELILMRAQNSFPTDIRSVDALFRVIAEMEKEMGKS